MRGTCSNDRAAAARVRPYIINVRPYTINARPYTIDVVHPYVEPRPDMMCARILKFARTGGPARI